MGPPQLMEYNVIKKNQILNYTANVFRALRGVCRFSLQYLWKRAVRITKKPYTPQRERLCMLLGNPEMHFFVLIFMITFLSCRVWRTASNPFNFCRKMSNNICVLQGLKGCLQSHYIEVEQGGISKRAIHNWLWLFSLFKVYN